MVSCSHTRSSLTTQIQGRRARADPDEEKSSTAGVPSKHLLRAATHESKGSQKREYYHTRDGSVPELASVKLDSDDPVRPLIYEEPLSRLLYDVFHPLRWCEARA